MMLAIAIWMLGRILPAFISSLLWAALLLVAGLNLAEIKFSSRKSESVLQLIGLCALIAGSIFAFKAISNKPMLQLKEVNAQTPFIEVKTLQAVEKQLASAKSQKKPAFLEFSASWCSDCHEMDKVLNQSEVIKGMTGLVAVKVDISENNAEIATIKKYFSIYGTPTMLFFDSEGKKLPELTAVGVINKMAMLKLFEEAIAVNK